MAPPPPTTFKAKDNALIVTLVIKIIFVAIFLIFFLILRKRFKWFYQYRYEQHHKGIINQPRNGLYWVIDTLRYNNSSIKDTTGLDGYMYLRNLRTCLKILFLLMVIGAIMIFPTNYFGNTSPSNPASGTTSLLSMGNIPRGSPLFWVHLVFSFFVTGVVLWFAYKDYQFYTNNRIELKKSYRLVNYVLLVKNIPKSLFTENQLSNYFKSHMANIDDLKDIKLIYPSNKLYGLAEKREKFVNKYECAIEDYKKSNKKVNKRIGFCGLFGEKRDPIEYNKEMIDRYDKEIEIARDVAEKDNIGGTGFIIFNQRNTQKEFVHTPMQTKHYGSFKRYQGPDSNDVFWKNINIGQKQFYVRSLIVLALAFALIFLSSIPVAFISGWSNAASLSQVGAFSWIINVIQKSPILQGILTGFAPNLVLFIFMRFLGTIIQMLCDFNGFYANSITEANIFSIFWAYQVFNVFFISAVAGTIFQSIGNIVSNPTGLITTIANALGGLSYQMINFILIASAGSASGIIRWKSFIVSNFKLKFLNKTPRQINATKHRGPFTYGVNYAKFLLIFQLSIAYSTLNPFILVFGTWYMGVTYLVHKHNIIWVNTPSYNANGTFSPMFIRRVMVSLIIYQILMLGTFNVNAFFIGTLILIPLFFTIAAWYLFEKMFRKLSKYGIMDQYERETITKGEEIENDDNIRIPESQESNPSISSTSSNADETHNNNINASTDSIINPTNQADQITYNDANHSIFEYNKDLYKPSYYNLITPDTTGLSTIHPTTGTASV